MNSANRQVQLGQRIRELRMAENLSVRRFALVVGTGYSHLIKIEKGEIDIRYSLLCRIADALGVQPGALTDDPTLDDR
ncbi:helix-turn-helix domain-containing protein [Eggerthella timonensis]|uniref:helix-turn-helix domain-containing protein n=1 Tax=Eggerthella timonensis TaxID=1871008 RepID=UPI000C762249|nr:helix-turn-helix transcriptional regulator [Eggerthella timonensis]